MKKAFTLAEVLITLGIIGVVAALVMPALIAHHKKKILEIRIKKFHSVLQKAALMKIVEDYEVDCSMLTAANDSSLMLQFFNTNYTPYMKTIKVETTAKGVNAAFPDGSGMFIRKSIATPPDIDDYCASTHVIFCVHYKTCKDPYFDTINNASSASDGRNSFVFQVNGSTPWQDFSREQLLEDCRTSKYYCSKLLQHDGWEIKDDYPFKI
ncbi:MAG: type II secretion system GspH family protein [Heliobacteriaceae bacterium]|jgi:prepilin-type N-terminal cleavage/methylation domain-containing protein|nr:type II secretion system GspH family protein [Heliobacteriaceae bacterium]